MQTQQIAKGGNNVRNSSQFSTSKKLTCLSQFISVSTALLETLNLSRAREKAHKDPFVQPKVYSTRISLNIFS